MKGINYTQVSNEFISEMHNYDGAEVKVFLAISRKTIGWHKTSDKISYTQLQILTGLAINTLKKAIETLVKDQWILQETVKNGFKYDLNIERSTMSIIDTPKDETVSTIDTPLSIIDTEQYQLVTPTLLKENKETKEKESDVSVSEDSINLKRVEELQRKWKVIALAYNLSTNVDCSFSKILTCLNDPLFDFEKITQRIETSKKLRGLGRGNSKANAITFQSIINNDNMRQQIMDGVFDDANQSHPVLFKDSPVSDLDAFKAAMKRNDSFKRKYPDANIEYYYDEIKSWGQRKLKTSGDWIEEAINFMRLDSEGGGLKKGGAGDKIEGQFKIRDGYGQN